MIRLVILKKASPKFLFRTAILFVLTLFLLTSCRDKQYVEIKGDKLQAAKDSIMATIEKETQSFFARDYVSWKSTYVQDEHSFQGWSNQDGTFDASVGWNAIDGSIGKYIFENPESQSSHPIVERKNINFKFYGNHVAFLTWDQFNSDKDGKSFHHSKEVRVMEKVNNEWKIACVAAFWDYKNLISADKLPQIEKMDKESRGSSKDKLQ